MKPSSPPLTSGHGQPSPAAVDTGASAAEAGLRGALRRLEAANAELGIVNRQLQDTLLALEAANAGLKSLLASCQFAALCLDHDLRLQWFTPAIADILKIIPADMGRPISHAAAGCADFGLLEETGAVLRTAQPRQREWQAENQRWYLCCLSPCRIGEGPVEGVTITFTDISESKRVAAQAIEAKNALAGTLERRVRERTRQLRAMAVELTLAEERERRKLAEVLHDDLGQVLAIAKIKLASMDLGGCGGGVSPALKDVSDLIGQASESVRSLVFQTSSLVLLDLGLAQATEWLAEEKRKKCGLSVAIHDDGEPKPLSEATKTILFRALRELLANAAKHSGSSGAEVSLLRRGAAVVVTVVDHGKGFDPKADENQAGFGLASIRERMGYLGGTLQIDSDPGGGTTVTLAAPLELD